MELEERFGVRLSEDAIARVNSLRDLLEEAKQAAATAPEELGRPSPEQERWLEPRSALRAGARAHRCSCSTAGYCARCFGCASRASSTCQGAGPIC